MRKTKLFISFLAAVTLMSTTLALSNTYVSATEISDTQEEDYNAPENYGSSLYKPNIYWVYKELPNGEVYKRLYDYDKGIWIGDWIRVK